MAVKGLDATEQLAVVAQCDEDLRASTDRRLQDRERAGWVECGSATRSMRAVAFSRVSRLPTAHHFYTDPAECTETTLAAPAHLGLAASRVRPDQVTTRPRPRPLRCGPQQVHSPLADLVLLERTDLCLIHLRLLTVDESAVGRARATRAGRGRNRSSAGGTRRREHGAGRRVPHVDRLISEGWGGTRENAACSGGSGVRARKGNRH